MTSPRLLAAISLALTLATPPQQTPAAQQAPPVQLTAAEDHQRLMDLPTFITFANRYLKATVKD